MVRSSRCKVIVARTECSCPCASLSDASSYANGRRGPPLCFSAGAVRSSRCCVQSRSAGWTWKLTWPSLATRWCSTARASRPLVQICERLLYRGPYCNPTAAKVEYIASLSIELKLLQRCRHRWKTFDTRCGIDSPLQCTELSWRPSSEALELEAEP